MREVIVGIIIKAKDQAGAAFDRIRSGASTMSKGVKDGTDKGKDGLKSMDKAAKDAGSAFKSLGGAIVVANQAFDLGKKALNGLKMGFEITVGKSLEYRTATDSGRIAWEAYNHQLDRMRGNVGDIILPLLLGLGDAVEDVAGATEHWIKQNRVLIGTQIVQYLEKGARVLQVVTQGVILAAEGFAGWSIALSQTQSIWSAVESEVLSGLSKISGAYAKLTAAISPELAMKHKQDQLLLKLTAEESLRTAKQHAADVQSTYSSLNTLRKRMTELGGVIDKAVGDTASKAIRRLKDEIHGFDPVAFSKFTQALEADSKALQTSLALIDMEAIFTPALKASWHISTLAAEVSKLEKILPNLNGPYLDVVVSKLKALKDQLGAAEIKEMGIATQELGKQFAAIVPFFKDISGKKITLGFRAEENAKQLARIEADTVRSVEHLKAFEITTEDQLLTAHAAYLKQKSQLSREAQIEIETLLRAKQRQFNDDAAKEWTASMMSAIQGWPAAIETAFGDIGRGGEELKARASEIRTEMQDLKKEMAGMSGTELVKARERLGVLTTEFKKTNKDAADAKKSWGDAFGQIGQMALRAAINFLTIKAVEAAANAFAGNAGIPFVGLAIAGGVALSAGIAVAAMKSELPSFHTGGVIPGVPGTERLARVLSGEGVIRSEFVPTAQALGMMPGGSSSSRAPVNQNASRTRVDVQVETLLPSRARVVRTHTQHLGPAAARARRLGWT